MNGINVELTLTNGERRILHNVTEIHYRHQPLRLYVAFESDIHGTGCNYPVNKVLEFETSAAVDKHGTFQENLAPLAAPIPKIPFTIDDFHTGEQVNVKKFDDDLFDHDFTGTVVGIRYNMSLVTVEDQDGDCWDCEPGQLSFSSDKEMHG